MVSLKIRLSTFFMVGASDTLKIRSSTPIPTMIAMGTTTCTASKKLSIFYLLKTVIVIITSGNSPVKWGIPHPGKQEVFPLPLSLLYKNFPPSVDIGWHFYYNIKKRIRTVLS